MVERKEQSAQMAQPAAVVGVLMIAFLSVLFSSL
jgi:hypothetical protein